MSTKTGEDQLDVFRPLATPHERPYSAQVAGDAARHDGEAPEPTLGGASNTAAAELSSACVSGRSISGIRFDTVHVAAYSPRAGTIADRELDDDIPAAEKKRRLNEIERLQEKIATEINARLLNRTVEVLVEGKKKGKWQGRTRSDKLVFFSDEGEHQGELVDIRVEKTSPWSLKGKIERNITA